VDPIMLYAFYLNGTCRVDVKKVPIIFNGGIWLGVHWDTEIYFEDSMISAYVHI
jgi:hypothetical protein